MLGFVAIEFDMRVMIPLVRMSDHQDAGLVALVLILPLSISLAIAAFTVENLPPKEEQDDDQEQEDTDVAASAGGLHEVPQHGGIGLGASGQAV